MRPEKLLNFAFLILILFSNAHAQTFTLIPSITAKMYYTHVSDSYNLAVMGGIEHYKSVDQGVTWTEMNNNPGSALYQVQGYNIGVSNASTMCILGRQSSSNTYVIVRTTDGGSNWTSVLSVSNPNSLKDIAAYGNTLIATAVNGIYRSVDAGLNWTFIPIVTSGSQISEFVKYNQAANSWIAGGYSTGFHISYDDGLTWQETNLGFPSSEVLEASQTSGGVLLSRETATTAQMFFLNGTNTPEMTVAIPENLVMADNNNFCRMGAFLSNNRLLTYNDYLFYVVDTITGNVYHVNYPTANGFHPQSLSLGSTYGIAFGTNNSGTQSKAYLINLAQPPAMSVPAYFEIQGPGPCAGDMMIAHSNASYADSYQWYVNNVLVSTSSTLNYMLPANVYTTYSVKLNTYYNGNVNTITKQVITSAPQSPHTFAYTVDTTACYGEPLHVFINPDAGSPSNTAIKILYNGQLAWGPFTMNSNNINAYTPALTTDGILQIISYKTSYCDPSADTITLNITVGPNLFDFEILPHDSVICTGISPILSLDGTNSLYSYTYNTTFSPGPLWVSGNTTTAGNSSGVLNITLEGLDNSVNNSVSSETYVPIYMYVHMEISDISGCSPSRVIDTIRVQRPTAYFELHSRSFLQSDTVELSNAFVTPNRLWSSPELNPVYIENETDIVPLIVADTTGFFGIKLHNEPLPGCIDTAVHYIHYAEPAPEMDVACQAETIHEADNLHHVRIDQFGNIYEVRAYYQVNYTPMYILRKNDPSGNFLWEKRGAYTGWGFGNISGLAIEEIDFDTEGNPVVVMWIQGTQSYHDDYFDFTSSPVQAIQGACYVAKINKATGELIWRSDLGQLSPGAALETRSRVTDVVVDGNLIHATTYAGYNLDFFTLNSSDGSLVHSEPFDFNMWSGSHFIPPGFFFPTGSLGDNRQSFWSPQIDVLSTGEVIAVGNYRNVPIPNYPQLAMSGSDAGLFVMKYHPDNGIYDVQKIAQRGNTDASGATNYLGYCDVPQMFVDKNDNITVASYWEADFITPNPTSIKVLDSILPMQTGTFVVNMDADYNMNWLSAGTHSIVEDLAYVAATNETYLVCKTRDNFSMGTGQVHIMSGENQPYDSVYTNLPAWEYPWLNFPVNHGFLTKLDPSGTPVEMKKYDCSTSAALGSLQISLRMDATPCGDLALFASGGGTVSNIEVDGQTYSSDSVMLFLYYSGCASDDCSYLDAVDTLELCSSNGTIEVQFADYFNLGNVTYDIVANGVTTPNQSSTVVNGQFSFQVPSGATGEISLIFNDPTADTMIIFYSHLEVNFGMIAGNTPCFSNSPFNLETGTPVGGEYSGPGVSQGSFDPGAAGIGSHVITYTYTNNAGCTASDTSLIVVTPDIQVIFGNISGNTPCSYYSPIILDNAVPAGGEYSGAGVSEGTFDPGIAGVGSHVITYTYTNANGCSSSDTSLITVNDCAGTESLNEVVFQVFPNPFTSELRVILPSGKLSDPNLVIYDNTGRIVFRQKLKKSDSSFFMEHLSKGKYVLEILDDKTFVHREQLIKM